MSTYYKPIASIELRHRFYASEKLPGAVLTPFPETALFFRNHRMLFKKKNDGYTILHEAALNNQQPTIPVEPADKDLFFGIRFNDAHYQLRCGLNYDPRFEKIVMETSAEDSTLVAENNVMPCRTTLPAAEDGAALIITTKNNAIVFDAGSDPKSKFDHLEEGIYYANGKPFFKSAQAAGFDAVLIFHFNAQEETMPAKTIVVPAGSYRWRYQVQRKYSQHETLSLVDENEQVRFNAGSTEKENLFIFLSEAPVPLSEQGLTSLVLYNNDLMVKKFLPTPGIESARFLSAEEKSLVLEAYVTI